MSSTVSLNREDECRECGGDGSLQLRMIMMKPHDLSTFVRVQERREQMTSPDVISGFCDWKDMVSQTRTAPQKHILHKISDEIDIKPTYPTFDCFSVFVFCCTGRFW